MEERSGGSRAKTKGRHKDSERGSQDVEDTEGWRAYYAFQLRGENFGEAWLKSEVAESASSSDPGKSWA